MAKYKPQHARLLFIDRKIREKRFPNCGSLAAGWEVSISTIQRDLDYMRYQLDAPIEYSAKDRGYFYTEEEYQLPAINIRESDLFAIYLADKLLAQYEGTPIYERLQSVFAKIEECLPDKVSARPDNDQELFTVFPPFSTVILPEVFETVFACLRTATRVEIDYQSPGAAPSRRRVDPYHGVRFEGDWYLVGFCHLRRTIRTFSLARISRVRKLPERFTLPQDWDFRQFTASQFGIHRGTDAVEVRIHFAASAAAYVRERVWHPSQTMAAQADGSLILTLTVNHLLELKRWILSWGEAARVLAPPALIEELQRTARELAARYDGQ